MNIRRMKLVLAAALMAVMGGLAAQDFFEVYGRGWTEAEAIGDARMQGYSLCYSNGYRTASFEVVYVDPSFGDFVAYGLVTCLN